MECFIKPVKNSKRMAQPGKADNVGRDCMTPEAENAMKKYEKIGEESYLAVWFQNHPHFGMRSAHNWTLEKTVARRSE